MKHVGPRTLDEAIEVLPGLRRFRSLDAQTTRRLLDRQKGECTWCGGRVPRGRRTWCGDACFEAWQLRCDTASIRSAVRSRDKERCHYCGCCCDKLRRVFRLADWTGEPLLPGKRSYREEFRKLVGDGAWEAHHVLAVVEGGGLCGLENIVTACVVCHKEQSSRLSERRRVTG